MFNKGDKIHLHDGSVVTIRHRGVPRRAKGSREKLPIRGFIRGELVDVVTGEKQTGDWHENVITTYGHGMIVKNFVGLTGSSHASFFGIGYHSGNSSSFSTQSAMNSLEYALSSGGAARATVSAQTQTLSNTYYLSQTYSYAATHLASSSTNASINCIAQYGNSSVGAGSALSIATFNSSEKSTNQALNVTYNWVFST